MRGLSSIDGGQSLLASTLEAVLKHRDDPSQHDDADNVETYSITDLAREYNVSNRALRFYEEKGLVEPERDRLRRTYLPDDRARVGLIIALKRAGMELKEIKEIFIAIDLGQPRSCVLGFVFQKFQALAVQLSSHRNEIDVAIDHVHAGISSVEAFLAADDENAATAALVSQSQFMLSPGSKNYLQKTAKLRNGRLVLRGGQNT